MMVGNKKRNLSNFIGSFGKSAIVEIETVLTQEPIVYRFGTNEDLLFNLDSAFRQFEVSNDAANEFFHALIERNENDDPNDERLFINENEIIFNQPSFSAYQSELQICEGIRFGEIPAKVFNEFIATHTAGVPLGEWMQSADAPLWQVRIFDGDKEIEAAVCNAVQAAIMCGFRSAKNPDIRHKITKA